MLTQNRIGSRTRWRVPEAPDGGGQLLRRRRHGSYDRRVQFAAGCAAVSRRSRSDLVGRRVRRVRIHLDRASRPLRDSPCSRAITNFRCASHGAGAGRPCAAVTMHSGSVHYIPVQCSVGRQCESSRLWRAGGGGAPSDSGTAGKEGEACRQSYAML